AVVPPPDAHDQVQLRQTAVDGPAVTKPADTPAPEPAAYEYEAVVLPPPDVSTEDAVIAPAEADLWWLGVYKHRPDTNADQSDPIPVREPTDADRAAAAVTAVWLGGAALATVAPEPRADDEEQRPPPETDEDETDA